MRFLDLFAGIGGFRRGLERSGHTCTGHVEIDKYANRSYMAMYDLAACSYQDAAESNSYMMCKTEVNEHCDGTNCKGEWYAKDIKRITAGEIPKAEVWTFGFPCSDVSISGRMAGIHGERSGLFFTVAGLLQSKAPQDKPQYIIVENVKHLVSSERGGAFTAVLFELWEAGYDCEWAVINSSAHNVPQHRERVYIVGHLRGQRRCAGKVFPVGRTNGTPVKRLADGSQGKRIYDPTGLSVTLTATGGGVGGRTGLYTVPVDRGSRFGAAFIDMNEGGKLTEHARCIKAKQNAGIVNHKGETSGVFLYSTEPGLPIREDKKEGYTMAYHEDSISLAYPNSRVSCGRVGSQCTQTLLTGGSMGVLLHCRIRRLTPRECWRLQAFDDYLFDRARAAGISDNQLYKQAGNAVTVNIVYEIGLRLVECEVAVGDEINGLDIREAIKRLKAVEEKNKDGEC